MRQLILIMMLILGGFIFIFGDEEIIIGREEGDGTLIYPQQVEEGPDGNIYVYDLADAYIKVYSPEGKLVKEISTPLSEPEKVTKNDLDEWRRIRKENIRDKQWYNRFGTVIEKYKKSIYEKGPNLEGISLTPDGNIFISGLWDDEGQKINYWLLDENGKTVAEIRTELPALEISKHFIFYRTTDEEENILIHCLKRAGTEKEDLLRLERK